MLSQKIPLNFLFEKWQLQFWFESASLINQKFLFCIGVVTLLVTDD